MTDRKTKIAAEIRAARGSVENMAARMDAAVLNLIEVLSTCGGINTDEARKVAAFYIKNKLVKSDFAIGRYKFTHGGFLDRAAIRRALEMIA